MAGWAERARGAYLSGVDELNTRSSENISKQCEDMNIVDEDELGWLLAEESRNFPLTNIQRVTFVTIGAKETGTYWKTKEYYIFFRNMRILSCIKNHSSLNLLKINNSPCFQLLFIYVQYHTKLMQQ